MLNQKQVISFINDHRKAICKCLTCLSIPASYLSLITFALCDISGKINLTNIVFRLDSNLNPQIINILFMQ